MALTPEDREWLEMRFREDRKWLEGRFENVEERIERVDQRFTISNEKRAQEIADVREDLSAHMAAPCKEVIQHEDRFHKKNGLLNGGSHGNGGAAAALPRHHLTTGQIIAIVIGACAAGITVLEVLVRGILTKSS